MYSISVHSAKLHLYRLILSLYVAQFNYFFANFAHEITQLNYKLFVKMKLRKAFASVVASVLCSLLLSACADIDDMFVGKDNGKILKIEARVGKAQTRVSTSENWSYNEADSLYDYNEAFSWENGDEIALCTSDGTVARYRTENGDGTFTPVSGGLPIPVDGVVRAVYPADVAANGWEYPNNSSNCFVAKTNVAQGEENISLEFKNVMSKLILRTYAEGGLFPVDIQPVLYGVSSYGSFNKDWSDRAFQSNSEEGLLLDEIDGGCNNDWNRAHERREYKSYSGLFLPSNGYSALEYKLYGIFDVKKYISNFEAGTLYEVNMKVPKAPTIDLNFQDEKVTIKLFLPEGCSFNNINRDDYEVKIEGHHDAMQHATIDSFTMPLPDISEEDSTLTFEVNPSYMLGGLNEMFCLSIYKKGADMYTDEPLYMASHIGVHSSLAMAGEWQGVETWYDEDFITMHTKSYDDIKITKHYDTYLMAENIADFRPSYIWISDDNMKFYRYENPNYLYIFEGSMDNPAYPTRIDGAIICAYRESVTDKWDIKNHHLFEMTRKN